MRNIGIGFLFWILVFSGFSVKNSNGFSNPKPQKKFYQNTSPKFSPFEKPFSLSEIERGVHFLINKQRRKNKRRPLRYDRKIARMARYYSRKMGREDFFDHYDRDGNSVVDRAEKFNIVNYRGIGENLFVSEGYRNQPDLAVRSWFKSRSHRRNFLKKGWTHTGVGAFITRDGRTYITQVFIKAD